MSAWLSISVGNTLVKAETELVRVDDMVDVVSLLGPEEILSIDLWHPSHGIILPLWSYCVCERGELVET